MKEFVDEVSFIIEAGHGGAGGISFRREPYVPNGGPDGGNGGTGGNVVFLVDNRLTTFGSIRSRKKFLAENGLPGTARLSDGRSGVDTIIKVPCGTVVYDETHDVLLADLTENGQSVVAAYGGKGGKGNKFYATPTNQAPDYAQHGLEGEVKNIRLEIKLIADIGFVGLPNAGKSSLLSLFTRANPKIASYPFTTLTPNLGVCYLDVDRSMVLADIPGIIEGASKGVGLGFMFLRHIERTDILLYVLDITSDTLFEDYQSLYNELHEYSEKLSNKKSFVLLNKTDLLDEEFCEEIKADFLEKIERHGMDNTHTVSMISALASEAGEIKPITEMLYAELDNRGIKKKVEPKKVETVAKSPKVSKYVFGPVNSKRLGHSLGIDVTPKKICTYDCVYCQIGKNEHTAVKPIETIDVDTIIFEVQKYLHRYKNLDYITFAGSGEPTLYKDIKRLIIELKHASEVPVCLITNGSLFYKQEIREQVLHADLIIPSLDAGCAETFEKINKPNAAIEFDKMVEGLIKFSHAYKGRLWLEVFIIEGVNDNEGEMNKIAEIVSKMKIQKLQLLTADRPVAYEGYKAVSFEKLMELGKCFEAANGGKYEIEVVSNPKNHNKYEENKDINEDDVLGLIARHPTTLEGIAFSLAADVNTTKHLLEKLTSEGKVEPVDVSGEHCFKIVK